MSYYVRLKHVCNVKTIDFKSPSKTNVESMCKCYVVSFCKFHSFITWIQDEMLCWFHINSTNFACWVIISYSSSFYATIVCDLSARWIATINDTEKLNLYRIQFFYSSSSQSFISQSITEIFTEHLFQVNWRDKVLIHFAFIISLDQSNMSLTWKHDIY